MENRKFIQYCLGHSTHPSRYLDKLDREAHLKTVTPQMSSGHLQGRILSMLSHLIRPRQILEIGTFTAYATLCLSEGLARGGVLHTIEINPELEYIIKKAIENADPDKTIISHIGNAKTIIPSLEGDFNLIFLDAAKEDYLEYYDLVFSKWAKGGMLVADNVWWGGKVLDPAEDPAAIHLVEFNKRILRDDRVENIILPIRDGLNLIRKK